MMDSRSVSASVTISMPLSRANPVRSVAMPCVMIRSGDRPMMASWLGLKKPPHLGSASASGGCTVCWLTPTTRSPAPMANTISVTDGAMQMTRR